MDADRVSDATFFELRATSEFEPRRSVFSIKPAEAGGYVVRLAIEDTGLGETVMELYFQMTGFERDRFLDWASTEAMRR
jgi:hypothetical protein